MDRLLETDPEGLPPLGQDALGRLAPLIEDADDRAILSPNGRQAVVPEGLLGPTVTHHGEHLVEGRHSLPGVEDLLELRTDDMPDVGPDDLAGLAECCRVALCRDRRPGVVVEQTEIRSPIDRGREVRVQADRYRRPQRPWPARRVSKRGRIPWKGADALSHFASARKKSEHPVIPCRLDRTAVGARAAI